MMDLTPLQLKANVEYIAKQLGFFDVRIAPIVKPPHLHRYNEWLEDKAYGDMSWFERNNDRRSNPANILEGAQSMVCLALNYLPGKVHPNPQYRVAKYSWNNDYHDLISTKLKDLDLAMQEFGGVQKYYVDTGPILERDYATLSGLGWNGKSTVQIHQKHGTWFFLAEVITTLELPKDQAVANRCGTCSRCMEVCPTNAIYGPNLMNAQRCISYLTIENKGSIPEEYRRAIGNRIYGCDECLEVCPWNKFAKVSREIDFLARDEIFSKSLRDFLKLSDEEFRGLFAKSPIKRIKRNNFLRNVCVALGNVGEKEDLAVLEETLLDPDPMLAEHADWAIKEIKRRELIE